MNNELERILNEVADGASRRTDALPVDALRGRGVRRRRTRQAGFAAVGVAAAFGLALGAGQIVPDDAPGPVAPAVTPTAPTLDSAVPFGACGSNVANMPVTDASYWIDMNPAVLEIAEGGEPPLTMWLENSDSEPLELTRGALAYLMVVEDGVVVGFSWAPSSGSLSVVPGGESAEITGFSQVVRCEGDEPVPSGNPRTRESLPAGDYLTYAAIGGAAGEPALGWAFEMIGREGTLTITDPDASAPDPVLPTAVDVELPVCGEPVDGWEFPEGVHVDPEMPLAVTVGHTGEDEAGQRMFYGDGYGDQLEITFDHVNRIADWASAREVDARAVVVRDGVVVAELAFPQWRDIEWTVWPLGEARSFAPAEDWVDCASGAHGQVPKGDYEILGWRTFEMTDRDGRQGSLTVGYEPAPFTAYDFEDPDNPGPGTD